jgi:hypothetical protein
MGGSNFVSARVNLHTLSRSKVGYGPALAPHLRQRKHRSQGNRGTISKITAPRSLAKSSHWINSSDGSDHVASNMKKRSKSEKMVKKPAA